MKKIIWAFGVRSTLRDQLQAVLPQYDLRFLSTKRSVLKEEQEILASGECLIALWKGAKAPDHDEFVRAHNLPVVFFSPIELECALEGQARETRVVGFRVLRKAHVERNDPLVVLPEAAGEGEDDLLWQLRVVSQPDNNDWLLKLPWCVRSDRRRVFIAPDEAWMDTCVAAGEAGTLVTAARAAIPDGDLVLATTAAPEFADFLASGDLAAVVRGTCRPEWLAAADAVITNDPVLARAARTAGIACQTALDLPGWTAPAVEEEDAGLPDAPAGEESAPVEERFLRGAYYFAYPPPPEDEPAPTVVIPEDRFAGLRALLARRREAAVPGGSVPPIETAATREAVDPAAIPVMALTGSYAIRHFDDRTRPSTLTCILPFRYAPERRDAIERLKNAALDQAWRAEDICFLVVDDGSEEGTIEAVREACRALGYSYIYNDSRDQDFSVGRCRNIGAEYARSQFIFMQDIDLMPYEGFYQDLLNEMDIQGMRENAKHFLMIPYVFLTESGTAAFQRTAPGLRRQKFIQAAITNDTKMVEKFSTGTSANVYNRYWFLTRGGNRREFEGWGYEDIEFNTRMIRHLKFFPLPRDWTALKHNFNSVVEYETYNAIYRLFGDMVMMKGIALFHAWHPVVRDSGYVKKAKANRELLAQKLKDFPATGAEPDPLPDRSKGKTLVLRKNAFTLSRKAAPSFGEALFLERETLIPNRATLEALVRHHGITRVLFFNPFQTPHMRRLQDWVRALGIPYLVAERGALPSSNFYDPNGFLFDSATYAPEQWNRPLTAPQRMKVVAYVDDLRKNRPALETQPPAIGGFALRQQLGIPADDIVIFVPLQRPGDTVTRFFSRGTSYAEFEAQAADLAARVLPGITVLIKTHPLEDRARTWGNALVVDDVNIYDLLEASNLVWTFNSGVGILAMAWEKHVALTGNSFYAAAGANSHVRSADDVIALARSGPVVETETVLRYLHHLTQTVYSFGKHDVKPVRMPDGSRMTATTNIDYTCLRIEGVEHLFLERSSVAVDRSSILFDRYRYAEQNAPPPAAAPKAKT